MKRNIRQYFVLILLIIAVFEFNFIGCGGGGSGSNSYNGASTSKEESQIYSSPSVYSSARGTFYVPSVYSDFIAQALEENTVKESSSITLIERNPKANESKLFGNDCTRIYRLIGAYKETVHNGGP